ncbi:MAG: hypothetical protein GKR87_06990 [Kiritimatiellae bacterium]|nr:hypothetical protein [Kiritimatiellia bacterium]
MLALARRVGDKQESREGKNVYTGFFEHLHHGGNENCPCVPVAFEVIKRVRLASQKINLMRWRVKTVLQNIVYCTVGLVRRAGRIELHFGKRCLWFDLIRDIAHFFG